MISLAVMPQKCGIHIMMSRQDKLFIIEKSYGKTSGRFVKTESSRLGCRMGLQHDSAWREIRFSKRCVNPVGNIPIRAKLLSKARTSIIYRPRL